MSGNFDGLKEFIDNITFGFFVLLRRQKAQAHKKEQNSWMELWRIEITGQDRIS